MKITRKQAILALLCAPAARTQINIKQSTSGDNSPAVVGSGDITISDVSTWEFPKWKDTGSLRIDLADEDKNLKSHLGSRGIDSIVIYYNGKIRTITAKEIWEALV